MKIVILKEDIEIPKYEPKKRKSQAKKNFGNEDKVKELM